MEDYTPMEENRLLSDNTIPATPQGPFFRRESRSEVKAVIKYRNPKKAPSYDLITNQILQKLSKMGIKYITQLCNAVLREGFFFTSVEGSTIIMIQKPSKSAELIELCRPISLLPILLKLFEKLLFSRITIIMEKHGLILDQQFGFRSKHATTEQIHRIVKRINNDMEAGRYCSVIFLDVSMSGFRQSTKNYFIKSKIDFQLISTSS